MNQETRTRMKNEKFAQAKVLAANPAKSRPMRALVQRVSEARVTVDGRVTGEIGRGLLILVCAMQTDSEAQSQWLARKIVNLRIFRDLEGKMNKSLHDVGGAARCTFCRSSDR